MKQLINLAHYHEDVTLKESIKQLSKELTNAKICDEIQMPKNVVRLNSTVQISIKGESQIDFQLVMPSRGNIKNHMISLLTPMGTAVMGHSSGDQFIWKFPSGNQEITIMNVEQEVIVSKINILR